MSPDLLVNINYFHPIELVQIVDHYPILHGQDGIVLGIPRDDKTFGDAGYCAMLTRDIFLGPSQLATGDLRARCGSVGDALPPHMNTLAPSVLTVLFDLVARDVPAPQPSVLEAMSSPAGCSMTVGLIMAN